jgi:hypothetical protein
MGGAETTVLIGMVTISIGYFIGWCLVKLYNKVFKKG